MEIAFKVVEDANFFFFQQNNCRCWLDHVSIWKLKKEVPQ